MALGSSLALLLPLALMLGGCGETLADTEQLRDEPGAALTLRAGDSLLHRLAASVRTPATDTVPADVVAALDRAPAMSIQIGRRDWRREGQLPAAVANAAPPGSGRQAWRSRGTPLPAHAEVTAATLDGRPLSRVKRVTGVPLPKHFTVWQDDETGAWLFWHADDRVPVLIVADAPGTALLQIEGDLQDLTAAFVTSTETSTLRAGAFGLDHRPALLLGGGETLRFTLADLAADELRLACGLRGEGLRQQGDRLVLLPHASDGAELVVEIRPLGDEGTTTVLRRALSPGEGWVDLSGDLGPWRGRDVALTVRVDPGPSGDAAWDRVLLAGLTLHGPAESPPRRPHVVIIDVDTLRADRLSCYGHHRLTTPGLDAWLRRWADDGAVLFEDCTAASSWTLPSTMSMLTGLAPAQHGVTLRHFALGPTARTLAEHLGGAGYESLGLVEGGFVDPAFGFARGFDRYLILPPQAADWSAAHDWLDTRRSERPFLLFVQSYAVHAPYADDDTFAPNTGPYAGPLAGSPVTPRNAQDEAAARGRALSSADRDHVERVYDAGVLRTDGMVTALLDDLDRRFDPDQLLVIFTSDHGDELFEHGGTDHGHTLFSELLHVPLVVRFPTVPAGPDGAALAPDSDGIVRSPQPVSLLDLTPTVLATLGLDLLPEFPGRPLTEVLDDPPGRSRPRVALLDSRYAAVQVGDDKLILPGEHPVEGDERPRLYDLGTDPGEFTDRAADAPERVAAMESLLEQYRQRYPQLDLSESETGTETLAALQQLGYLGDG